MDVLQSLGIPQRLNVETDEQVVQAAGEWFEILENHVPMNAHEVDLDTSSDPILAVAEADDAVLLETDTEMVFKEEVDINETISPAVMVSIQEHATTSKWDPQNFDNFNVSVELTSLVPEAGLLRSRVGSIVEALEQVKSMGNAETRDLDTLEGMPLIMASLPVAKDFEGHSSEIIRRSSFEPSGEGAIQTPAGDLTVRQGVEIDKNSRTALESTAIVTSRKTEDLEIAHFEPVRSDAPNTKPAGVQPLVPNISIELSKPLEMMVQTQAVGDKEITILGVDGSKDLTASNIARFADQSVPVIGGLVQASSPSSPPQIISITPRDQPVVFQVSQAIEAAETGAIELRLDPAELGKVRITMSARDGVMLATIAVERAETLELLRRNSESLDMTFNDQGFGETVLDFQQFDQGDESEKPDEPSFASGSADASDMLPTGIILQQTSDGLDIRL